MAKKLIRCKHYKNSGFGYDISDEEELCLCEQCHLNLAAELLKQMATMVFANAMVHYIDHESFEKQINLLNQEVFADKSKRRLRRKDI
jgi:hypothetical protein